jgi:diguanylate cyclase (GGDEF)-like protein
MDTEIGARESELSAPPRAPALPDVGLTAGIDRICALAAEVLRAPVALVSLLDADRQWLEASFGLEAGAAERARAFARRAIGGDRLFVVSDALSDPRLAGDRAVVEEPRLRFYAAAPLMLDPGLSIGALSVIDRRPREFGAGEKALLRKLSALVVDHIRLREAMRRLKVDYDAHHKTEEVLESRQRDLVIHQRMFLQVEHLARIGAWEFDLKSRELRWSDEVYRIYDLPIGGPIPRKTGAAAFSGQARVEIYKAFATAEETGRGWDLILPFQTVKGRKRWVHSIGEVEIVNGQLSRLFGTIQDVTELQAKDETIRHLAHHDGLTGLTNRTFFQERLEAHLESASGGNSAGALVLIDIDRFKEINDKNGHLAGDAVLTAVAGRLRGLAREGDIVARTGGDEFAALCPGLSDRSDIEEFARRLLAEVGPPIALERERFNASLSIGIVRYPQDASTAKDAVRNADIALYRSKELGRNRFTLFESSMLEAIRANAAQSDAFERALQRGELVPYYQPVVDPRTWATTGFEALARWRHPERGLLAPGHFQTIFDQERLVTRLTRQMLKCVIEDMADWLQRGIYFGRIGVNLTTFDLLDPGFADEVLQRLAEAGIPTSNLVVELTEQVALSSSFDAIAASLRKLAKSGVSIAFDDFGTGHASLTHITSLPVHVLKLDQSFIKGITTSATCRAIIRSVVTLGADLGFTIVAEGVETQEQIDAAIELGCDRVQGYFFSKPMPASRVKGFLSRMDRQRTAALPKTAKNRAAGA